MAGRVSDGPFGKVSLVVGKSDAHDWSDGWLQLWQCLMTEGRRQGAAYFDRAFTYSRASFLPSSPPSSTPFRGHSSVPMNL